MFLGPLLHRCDAFDLPYAGGCNLGDAHRRAAHVGAAALRPRRRRPPTASTTPASTGPSSPPAPIVLTERGDTVTENALMAAALHPGTTIIRNASSNYMVQDLCFFLQKLGVRIDGIGTTTLTRHRPCATIDVDVEYSPSEDPIEAMSLLAAAIVTESDDHHPAGADRVPRDRAGARSRRWASATTAPRSTSPTTATPGWWTSPPSPRDLQAPLDKIHPMPFPGLNIDNLPFFAVIAAVRRGPDDDPRLGLREPGDLPHRAEQARRPGQAARPAPGA